MKKILLIVTILLICLGLSSCNKNNSDMNIIEARNKYTELKYKKYILEKKLSSLNDDISNLDSSIDEINNMLEQLQNQIDASFEDFATLENNLINSSVSVTHYSYVKTGNWIFSDYEYIDGALGSGFVVSEDKSYFYILTNNHVIYNENNTNYEKIYVYDKSLNEYEGTILFSDANYDMALIKISKTIDSSLVVIKLSENDPKIGDIVTAIGEPNGQFNSIAYGKVLGYNKVNFSSDSSNVKYDVIHHNAFMLHGSSGGMLVNDNYQVVGINTWGTEQSTYNKSDGYSSPVSKIREFLNNNSFQIGGSK